jgi:hypothetical protein
MLVWRVRALTVTGLQFALICFSPFSLLSQNTSKTSSATAPLQPYGGCPAPSQEGINICGVEDGDGITSPFQMVAAATSGRTPFDEPIGLEVGTHELTFIEHDTTGAEVKSTPIQVIVDFAGIGDGDCPVPDAPGVNVCAPVMASGCQSSGDTVAFIAAGKGKSGTVSRMELWTSGTKLANFPGDRFYTNVLNQFYPTVTFTIYEVDSKGDSIASSPIVVGGPC